jgi:cell wall-associated NlpC family hydrolase
MATSKRLGLAFLLALMGSLAVAGGTAAEPREIQSAREQAGIVLAQIDAIDMELDRAVDAWNGATLRLSQIEERLAANSRQLRVARASLRRAQDQVSDRLYELYTSTEPDTVDVLLGATSLSDLLDRVETADRVADQDARIAAEVRRFKAEVARRQRDLKRAKAEQQKIVAERAAQRLAIEQRLAQRQALYSSIQGQIADLQAQERRRQERLAAHARAQAAAIQRQQPKPRPQRVTSPQPPENPEASSAPSPAPAPTQPPASPPPAGPGHPEVVPIALRYLGVPYRWGGASPSGFDCSGLVMYVYGKIGISLPHHAASQYGFGRSVSRSQLRPGDLVFFNGLSHVGIYVGGGSFVHAPHTGDVVKISSLWDSWYAATWVGGRRLG